MPANEAGEVEKESEGRLVANIRAGYVSKTSVEIPQEFLKVIDNLVLERASADVRSLLPELLREQVTEMKLARTIDSPIIGILVSSLVSMFSALFAVQEAINGNIAIAQALIVIVLIGIVGAGILLYARAR